MKLVEIIVLIWGILAIIELIISFATMGFRYKFNKDMIDRNNRIEGYFEEIIQLLKNK